MASNATKYDFIVVGAGPAGTLVADRLARSKKHPNVLLIEAGGKNDSMAARVDAERWLHRMIPSQNWGYQTTPQSNLDNRVISYDRGKGLAGSTSINFSLWSVGPQDDHNEIARIVGDKEWSWDNAKERYKRIESFYGAPEDIPAGFEKYINAKATNHGHNGPIKVGFPLVWEKSLQEEMDAWLSEGFPSNPDPNDGSRIGMAISASTAYKGVRSTAADALVGAPSNLHIKTDVEVGRILFDGNKATGVATHAGESWYASKEVILCSGSLDTPRILMHSGIGPHDQLNKYNISVLRSNSNVGQHLKDHHHITPTYVRSDNSTERHRFYKSQELQAAARRQWELDHSGPLAEIACALGIGFLKLDSMLSTPEFRDLPEVVKEHLQKPSVPLYEVALNGPTAEYFMDPEHTPAATTVFLFLLNLQSTGSVILQSSDPRVPLLFDPNFFSHPYDKKLAVEATRDLLKVVNGPEFSKNTVGVMSGPKSDSEEDILRYWKETTNSTWHMTGTCRMGKDSDEAVVDKDFKVFGVQGLRIADMSVVPILPNNHTQTTAYLVGLTAGDRLVSEYNLDEEA